MAALDVDAPRPPTASPLVYQYRFSDADPWHLIIANGSTRAEPGVAPDPTLVLESSWADFVSTAKPDTKPAEAAAAAPPAPPRPDP